MVDQKSSRKYELRKRADNMAETRKRITEATVALHGTVGPARTTVAAIAEQAGVQRHTVYRHFPTDEDLFAACTTHYWALHPWPDPRTWEATGEWRERLRTALGQLYAFYAGVEPMMSNVLRDADVMSVVKRAVQDYLDYVGGASQGLADAIAPGRPLTAAAVRHAVDFRTWQSLVEGCGLEPDDAIALMVAMVESTAAHA